MPLISFKEMLNDALNGNYAVGYFEAWNEDSLEAVVSAAEEVRAPVIIGFGSAKLNEEWFDAQGLEYFAALGRVAVEKSKVPVCFILNEVKKYEQCLRGIQLGFNVVMMDTSHLPFKENLQITRQLVETAHAQDVAVEAELGRLPEANKDTPSSLTDPEEAKKFVGSTKVDALSVSIGNVHLHAQGEVDVDLDRLRKIREAAGVPLVIHGGTGFPREAVRECVRLGVAKFNLGTVLKQVYYEGIKGGVEKIGDALEVQEMVYSRKTADFSFQGRQYVKEKVKEFLKLYGSAGRA